MAIRSNAVETGFFERAAQQAGAAREPIYLQQAADLKTLSDLLADRRPVIERFVRVACPANGTTLASGRLDLYLSILLNGIRLVLPAHPVVSFLNALIPALIKERANPATLPGLEAQMPESPLIAVLNRRDVTVSADLSVIAGDLAGGSIWHHLTALVTDLFYAEDHDLVVPTRAMVGGAPRKDGKARLYFDNSKDINHFHYFRTSSTAEKMLLGLVRGDNSDAGFEPITTQTADELRRRDAGAAAPAITGKRPVVFLLPGIMGSELQVAGDRVWIDLFRIAAGRFDNLAIARTDVKATALVARSYARLSQYLAASHDVLEFPYDWRRTVAESADALARAVDDALRDTRQPIRILAHSMGGLVARTMIAKYPALWGRVVERDASRLVMLGTPNRGAWVVPRLLLGRDRLTRILSLIDLKSNEQQLLQTVAAFAGLIEMLPADPDNDLFTEAGWRTLDIDARHTKALPSAAVLQAARATRQLLESPDSVDARHMVYVAGGAPATPFRYRTSGASIEFMATSQGDGTVPWSLGLLEGVPTFYMPVKHGDMANVQRWFGAIQALLERGDTNELPQQPPAADRGAPREFVLPDDEVTAFPEQADLEAVALMGDAVRIAPVDSTEPLTVTIAHGNLAFARYPVMVGHYQGDTIAGAELALDQRLEGLLTEHQRLDLYADAIGTLGIFLRNDGSGAHGALVVGLGKPGSLAPGTLERTVLHGTLAFASKLVELEGDYTATRPMSVGVAALLIGSGRGGMPVEDSVRAIVAGVTAARDRLGSAQKMKRVRIQQLQFIELYEDIALQAVSALQRLQSDARYTGHIVAMPALEIMSGGRRRVRFEEEGRWWNHIQVTERLEDGALEFRNLTQRARAESYLEPTQKQLIDSFVSSAIALPRPDPVTAGALFELLVPNALKEYAPDQNDLVLAVDEASARFPWELMEDRRSGQGLPIAVRTGLVRNLLVDTFRERPGTVTVKNAFVVGDPPSELPELKGAQREAEAVNALLQEKKLSVTYLSRPSAQDVVGQLFARDYRILHFAAHGLHEYEITVREARTPEDTPVTRKVSGMVIGPNYTLLTPAEIEKMRAVPELVFVNCCHLGRTDEKDQGTEADQRRMRHRLAANIAAQFIRMGVRAVIAAGWAVDDDAAITFATTFYRVLLSGRHFGEAVKEARETTYREHPAVNTWGAYQCYGDPGFRLDMAKDEYEGEPTVAGFAARSEVIVELHNIAQDAETLAQRNGAEKPDAGVRRIEAWVRDNRAEWLADASVLTAFARAYRELDCFDQAIRCYDAARSATVAEISIRELEQAANLRSRIAFRTYLASGRRHEDHVAATREIRGAISDLDALPPGRLTEARMHADVFTSERLALFGSAQKRLTALLELDEWVTALRRMMRYYQNADRLARGLDAYPALNWLSACAVLQAHGLLDVQPPDWSGEGERIRAAARKAEEKFADFWQLAAEPEVMLIQGMASLQIAVPATITAGYRRAWQRGGSPRKMRSVLEHLDWLTDVLGRAAAGAPPEPVATDGEGDGGAAKTGAAERQRQRQSLIEAIREIRSELATLMGE